MFSQVTNLKIRHNPFAKGFRENSTEDFTGLRVHYNVNGARQEVPQNVVVTPQPPQPLQPPQPPQPPQPAPNALVGNHPCYVVAQYSSSCDGEASGTQRPGYLAPYPYAGPSGASDVSRDPQSCVTSPSLLHCSQTPGNGDSERNASLPAACSALTTSETGAGYQASELAGPDKKASRKKLKNGPTSQRKRVPSSAVTSPASSPASPCPSPSLSPPLAGILAPNSLSSVPVGIHRFTDKQAASAFDTDSDLQGARTGSTSTANGGGVTTTSLEQSKYLAAAADQESSCQFQNPAYMVSHAAPTAPLPASSVGAGSTREEFMEAPGGQASVYAIGPALMQSLDNPAQNAFSVHLGQRFSPDRNFLQHHQQQSYYPLSVSVTSSSSSSSSPHFPPNPGLAVTHFLQSPAQMNEVCAQNPAPGTMPMQVETNPAYSLAAPASNVSPARGTQGSPHNGYAGVPNVQAPPTQSTFFSAAQTAQVSPQDVFGMSVQRDASRTSPHINFSGPQSLQQHAAVVTPTSQGSPFYDMGMVQSSQGFQPHVVGTSQDVSNQGSPPRAIGMMQNVQNQRPPTHVKGMAQNVDKEGSPPDLTGMKQRQQTPSPLAIQTRQISPLHTLELTHNSQTSPLTSQNSQTSPLTTQNSQTSSLTTQNSQTSPFTTQNCHSSPLTIQNSQTSPFTTQNSQISSQNSQTSSLTTQDSQISPRTTQNSQIYSFINQNSQTSSLTTQNSQTSSLTTQNSQISPLTTQNSQTSPLTTQSSQISCLTNQNNQTSSLTSHDGQISAFATQNSQISSLTTQDIQVSPLTTQNSYIPPFNMQKSQTSPQFAFGVSRSCQQAFPPLSSSAGISRKAQRATQSSFTSSARGPSQFLQTPRPLYQSCQISAMTSGGTR